MPITIAEQYSSLEQRKITLKVYAHTSLDAMRQALGKLDGRLS
ncbi:hypothetical protein [Micromonospora sp. DT47]